MVKGIRMELKIGTMLLLEPTYTDRIEKLRCKVVEQGEGVIYIDYPIDVKTNKTAFLIDGAEFRVTFQNEAKQSFAFTTEVLGRQVGDIPMIKLKHPPQNEFLKIQRREYVRVQTPVDIAVEVNGEFKQYVTEDISAGGVLLNLRGPAPFEPKDRVKLLIVLPYFNKEIRYIQIAGVIVSVFERDGRFLAAIQFLDTDDIDKQYFVRFCFERQLQIRKKELNEL